MPLNYCKLYIDSPELSDPKNNGDAGYDLRTYTDIRLEPNIPTCVGTGIAVEIPFGAVGLVLGRSGLAFKHNVAVFHIGTIDSGYRGEIKILLINNGSNVIEFLSGERIAQLVVLDLCSKVYDGDCIETSKLSDTDRSNKGFGSTGRK